MRFFPLLMWWREIEITTVGLFPEHHPHPIYLKKFNPIFLEKIIERLSEKCN